MTEKRQSTYTCDRCHHEQLGDPDDGGLGDLALSSAPVTWLTATWWDKGPHGDRLRTLHFCETCKPKIIVELQPSPKATRLGFS